MDTSSKLVSSRSIVIVTCLLMALGPATVDLSLPALPAIQQGIGMAGQHVEWTLTAVLLGMTVGQFLIGGVADAFGRKVPIIASLSVFATAAVACALSPDLTVLSVARFVQAFGLGVAVVMARSVVVDAFSGRDVARVFSTAIMVTGVTTVIAPLAGGQLLAAFGWQSIFLTMAGLGVAVVLYVLFLVPETLPRHQRTRTGVAHVLSAYLALLRDPTFSSCALIASCAAASQFAYNTGAAAVLIEHHGLSPSTCGVYLAVIALSMAICSQLNGLLLRWLSPKTILSWAVPATLFTGLITLATSMSNAGGVNGIASTLLLDIALVGFIIPNALAVGMMSAGVHAGAGSALIGVLMFALGTLGSAVVGAAHDPSGRWMAGVICAWACFALLQLLRLRRPASATAPA
jgi:DHA1 family bicyclomycin/chloramphenicol resistance-like MFS transporter